MYVYPRPSSAKLRPVRHMGGRRAEADMEAIRGRIFTGQVAAARQTSDLPDQRIIEVLLAIPEFSLAGYRRYC